MPHSYTKPVATRSVSLALTIMLGLALLVGASRAVHAQEGDAGAIIVQFDDHAVHIRPIELTQPLSGLAALEQSGLDFVTADAGFGPAVCSIEGVGCPVDNCFCDEQQFWAYSAWDGAAWQPYDVGAGVSIVEPGAIEGWRWGPFESGQTPAPAALAAQAALDWLANAHADDGSLNASIGGTVESLLLLGGNGLLAADWPPGEERASVEEYVQANGAAFARLGPAESGKLAAGLAATAACWPEAALRPATYFDEALGAYSRETGFHLWAVLGAQALGDAVPDAAIQSVLDRAQPDGGWEWSAGWGADTNTTALAVQALRAAGLPTDDPAIQAAVAFLRTAQAADGGFVYDPASAESGSDVNSTAYAIQALIAAGEDPAGETWRVEGISPLDYLLNAQLADGSFEWQPGTGVNPLSTQQAATALLGATFPTGSQTGLPDCATAAWPAWFEALMRMPLSDGTGQ